MSVIYIALPVAVALAAGALLAFIWATRGGQYDDLDTPPLRMLHDDADESHGG
jgi:cbb3-type cytochrome oxidase maturation protein